VAQDITPEHKATDGGDEPDVIFDPYLGRFVPRGPPKHPRHPSRTYLSACVVVMAAVGGVIWFVYIWIASISGLFCTGGQVSDGSLTTATFLGVALWLAASVILFRLRRRLTRIFVSFVSLYILGLVAVWFLSPLMWGPMQC